MPLVKLESTERWPGEQVISCYNLLITPDSHSPINASERIEIMVSPRPFGNDPSKIEKYRAFWNREDVERPLAGFTFRGFFPIEEYKATSGWQTDEVLTPDMVTPEEFMEDEERLLGEAEVIDDDIIRGDSPLFLESVPFTVSSDLKFPFYPGSGTKEYMNLMTSFCRKMMISTDIL